MLKESVLEVESFRKEPLSELDLMIAQTELREKLMKKLEAMLLWCSLNDREVTISPMHLGHEKIKNEPYILVKLSMKFVCDVAEVKK